MKSNGNHTHIIPTAQRAVVIGSGIAGLAAARVLAKYYQQVTVLDRDLLPSEVDFRPGIPQAYHAHTLVPFGQSVLEELFPGMVESLLRAGAQKLDDGSNTIFQDGEVWRMPAQKYALPSLSFSRPLLEGYLYRAVTGFPQIEFKDGVDVLSLSTDEKAQRVTGVAIRNRYARGPSQQIVPADLVVDASGRNAKTPRWLVDLGYQAPEEWRINAHGGYASRIYRQPAHQPAWKKLYISPLPPDGTRGGIILPLEGSRWHVTLIGLSGDYPPVDEDDFLAFARSLPSPAIYEAIQSAEPLNKIVAFRNTENRVRRFENLPCYLEGLLVLGDAVFTMNPVYALGMTAALVSSQVLDEVLATHTAQDSRHGLAEAFQKQLAERVSSLWRQAVTSDWRWPATEVSDNTEALYPPVEITQ